MHKRSHTVWSIDLDSGDVSIKRADSESEGLTVGDDDVRKSRPSMLFGGKALAASLEVNDVFDIGDSTYVVTEVADNEIFAKRASVESSVNIRLPLHAVVRIK